MIEAARILSKGEMRLSKRDTAKVLESLCPSCDGELNNYKRKDGIAYHGCPFCGCGFRTRLVFKGAW